MAGRSVRRTCARLIGLWFAICGLAAINSVSASAAVSSQPVGVGNPDAESWVRSQVLAGKSADLNDFGGGAKTLGAGFLADLLAGPSAAQVPRHGVIIANGDVVGDLDLHNAEVPAELGIMSSRFHGVFDASGSHFHRQLRLAADFEDRVVFVAARADMGVDLRSSNFLKTVDFSDAVVSTVFDASGVHFSGATEPSDLASAYEFQRMVVAGAAFMLGTLFDWPAHFALAHFGSLDASDAHFGKNVFTHAEDVNYSSTNFSQVTIDQDASLGGAFAPTGIALTAATIGRSLVADGVDSGNSFVEVDLMNVQGNALVRDWKVGILRARNAKFLGSLLLDGLHATELYLSNSSVQGLLSLRRSAVTQIADFRNAAIGTLRLDNSERWPSNAGNVQLSGMTYSAAQAPLAGLRRLIAAASYDADAYRVLESALQKSGDTSTLGAVVDEHHTRQRLAWWQSSAILDWTGDWLSRLISNYGRTPQWALIWAVLVVAFGALVFRPRFMERADHESDAPEALGRAETYNPVAYSLGVFVPALRLRGADAWQPKSSNPPVVLYRYVHQGLGWVLVGISLLLLSGLTKSV